MTRLFSGLHSDESILTPNILKGGDLINTMTSIKLFKKTDTKQKKTELKQKKQKQFQKDRKNKRTETNQEKQKQEKKRFPM